MADLQALCERGIMRRMAGNAAGAAKARAKLAERRAAQATADQPQQTAPGALIVADGAGLVPVAPVAGPVPQSGQAVAAVLVDQAAPEAVAVMVATMRQTKDRALRFDAARRLLEMALSKDGRKGGADIGNASRLYDALARIAALRRGAAGAETVVPAGDDAPVPSEPGPVTAG
jgi:hypothetical protein